MKIDLKNLANPFAKDFRGTLTPALEQIIETRLELLGTKKELGDLRKKVARGEHDKPLNIKEAAVFLGKSVSTVRRLVRTGKLPYLSKRPYLFDAEDLRRFRDSGKRITAPACAARNGNRPKRNYRKALGNIGLGKKGVG